MFEKGKKDSSQLTKNDKNYCSRLPDKGELVGTECKPKLKTSIEDDSFEIDVKVLEEAKIRSYLTITVISIAVILALIASIYGFITGDFAGLVGVGVFIDAPLMSVLWYYYGKPHDDKED